MTFLFCVTGWHPHLKKNLRPIFSTSLSAVFVGNSVTLNSTLANNKRSFSEENFRPKTKLRFFCFSGETLARFCHAVIDFREGQRLSPDYFDHAQSTPIGDPKKRAARVPPRGAAASLLEVLLAAAQHLEEKRDELSARL